MKLKIHTCERFRATFESLMAGLQFLNAVCKFPDRGFRTSYALCTSLSEKSMWCKWCCMKEDEHKPGLEELPRWAVWLQQQSAWHPKISHSPRGTWPSWSLFQRKGGWETRPDSFIAIVLAKQIGTILNLILGINCNVQPAWYNCWLKAPAYPKWSSWEALSTGLSQVRFQLSWDAASRVPYT